MTDAKGGLFREGGSLDEKPCKCMVFFKIEK